MNAGLTIALSKGRLLEESLPLLARAGIVPDEDILASRKLVFDASPAGLKLLVIRAQDVPTFVQYGAADLGISGKDVLIEHGGEGIYEPLDLKIATCKLMLAGPEGFDLNQERLRVATKYFATTRRYFARQGRQVDLIKLYGSMELAPLVGLADCIVDLVATGGTLKANGLRPLEHIMDISARVVVNKASMKMKHQTVKGLLDRLAQAVR